MHVKNLAPIATLLAALAGVSSAQASSLNLACTEYQSSENPANCTTGASAQVLSSPGVYLYGDASLQPASSTGGIITGSTYPTGYAGASFYDAFVIQVTNSTGDSISSTINLPPNFQITGFEERLYAYTGTAPTIGPVKGALDAWTIPVGTLGTVAVLPATFLAAGTYVLEVRGDVTGTSGGAYAGAFQLTAVPLPAALPLLFSGMGGLGAFGGLFSRRRRSTAAA